MKGYYIYIYYARLVQDSVLPRLVRPDEVATIRHCFRRKYIPLFSLFLLISNFSSEMLGCVPFSRISRYLHSLSFSSNTIVLYDSVIQRCNAPMLPRHGGGIISASIVYRAIFFRFFVILTIEALYSILYPFFYFYFLLFTFSVFTLLHPDAHSLFSFTSSFVIPLGNESKKRFLAALEFE